MGVRIVPRYQRVELGEPYVGVWLDARVNPPMSVYESFIRAGQFDDIKIQLARLTQATNLEDEDGTPIDLSVTDGWSQVPKDFLEHVVGALMEAISGPKATPEMTSSGPTSATAETPPASTP